MSRMDLTRRAALVLVLAMLTVPDETRGGDGDKVVYKYAVNVKGKKVGWSKAVVKDTPQGKLVDVTVKMQTTVLGQSFSMSTRMKTRYDGKGRAASFESDHDSPKGKFEVRGKMVKGGGYEIVRSEDGGKSETETISAGSFDAVSVEPSLFARDVGSKSKLRVLFTTSGEVRKVTVAILDRSQKTVLGETRTVTHCRIKGSGGTTEEWRTEEGVLVKSLISTPLGKIVVKLTGLMG